jgi:protein transport protein SEC24
MGSYPPTASQVHQGYQYPGQEHLGAPPHGAYAGGMPTDAGVGTLAADMGNLNVNEASAVAFSRGAARKKHRHAHHNLEPSRPPSFPTSPFAPQTTPIGQPFSAPAQQTPGSSPYNPSAAGTGPHHGIPTPGFETIQTSSPQGRVDPDHIPSLPRSRDVPAQYFLENIYATLSNHLPPAAAVPFVAYDQGNSSPKFARLTMNNIPSTAEALASTSLPLGLLLQPLAPLQEGELPIPVLDFGEAGPPRCRRCRAYVNPFVTFKEGGNRFVCNMCNFPNEVSTEYFMPLDPQGVRIDRQQRPELMRGTVEFMVPKEYWNKDPVPLRILFVIDVSQEAVNRGFLESFCEGILAALYGQDESSANSADTDGTQEQNAQRNLAPGSKVGIITFDKAVHFYNLLVSYFYQVLSTACVPLLIEMSAAWIRKGADDGCARYRGSVCTVERWFIRRPL